MVDNNSGIQLTEYRTPRTWTDFSYLRWKGRDKPSSNLGKVKMKHFLEENNFRTIQILRTFGSAQEISLAHLPDYFVLKPAALWSSKGVMILHRIAGLDRYYDARTKTTHTTHSVATACSKLEDQFRKKLQFIVENRVLDEDSRFEIPRDYKVFTFHGIPKFVLQVDRNHKIPKIAFFDGEFKPILDDRVFIPREHRRQTQGECIIPNCFNEILQISREITLTLNAPFISVDCYATPEGAVVGEFTHTPGGPWYGELYRFSSEFDLDLGREWARAYQRLGIAIPKIPTRYDISLNGKVYRSVT